MPAVNAAETESVAYCAAHCTAADEYVSDFYCTDTLLPFCCGDLNTRYCCNNASLDVTDIDHNIDECTKCCGQFMELSKIYGTMAVALCLVVVLIVVCLVQYFASYSYCRQCLTKRMWTRPSSRGPGSDMESTGSHRHYMPSSRNLTAAAVSSTRSAAPGTWLPPPPDDFDPAHPFAFHPPDYDSLAAVEPPKYDDIELGGAAVDLELDAEEQSSGVHRGEGVLNTGYYDDGDDPPPPPTPTPSMISTSYRLTAAPHAVVIPLRPGETDPPDGSSGPLCTCNRPDEPPPSYVEVSAERLSRNGRAMPSDYERPVVDCRSEAMDAGTTVEVSCACSEFTAVGHTCEVELDGDTNDLAGRRIESGLIPVCVEA